MHGDALQFAQDCASLLNGITPSYSPSPPREELREAYRALALRYAQRTRYPRPWTRQIPAAIQAGLDGLAKAMRKHVVPRMDQEFEIPGTRLRDPPKVVRLADGYLVATNDGRRSVEHPRRPWSITFENAPDEEPADYEPLNQLRSKEPLVAIGALLECAVYWPFLRCRNLACTAVFVPNSRKQRYCGDPCRKIAHHAAQDSLETRRKAGESAKKHRQLRASGAWVRQRAPGAGRPRKEALSRDPKTARESDPR